MEIPSSMTGSRVLADPRADIEANARNIIMKTRASIAHLARTASRGRPGGVSAVPVRSSKAGSRSPSPRSN